MDQATNALKIKMKYLDKVKVIMLTSREEHHLSSMDNLKKLVYKTFPELEKLCENATAWRRVTLDMKCEDADGDLITIEYDGDLKSFLLWQKSNHLIFHLDTKERDSGGSSSLFLRQSPVIASSSAQNSVKAETRAKKQPCRYYARGHCKSGTNCTFSHDQDARQDRNGRPVEQPGPRNLINRSMPGTQREITNFGFWLREQLEREPIDNITFLSRAKGLDVLTKLVERKNLPSQWIDLLVKLITREEFRLSLMREYTNKVYGLLIGSTFLLQLHGHIITQLGTAKPQEIMPYLLLMEELQTRTTNGWKEVPLDGINSVIQRLEESGAKKELLLMVNCLIDHRNKLHRQAAISPADDETHFIGTEFRNISIVPNKAELLQPHLSVDLPVNLVGKRYTSVLSYLETHFRLLREDCIDPLRQGIYAFRNKQSSKELRIYQQRVDMEKIPFTKYLLDLERQVDPPFYLQRREKEDEFDFESVFPSMIANGGKSVINLLQDWPQFPSSLDRAQLHALKHGLTKELSIIQGPPGTGKTFLGLLLVRLLLANFKPAVPAEQTVEYTREIMRGLKMQRVVSKRYGRKGPILVICMTNHALDQFLEGIYKFERNVIRIGGRSKSTVLQDRTLKKLLEAERLIRGRTGHLVAKGRAWFERGLLEEEIEMCINQLNATRVKKNDLVNIATDEQIRNLFSVGMNSKETVERWLAGDVVPVENRHFYPFEESFEDLDKEPVDLKFEKRNATGKKKVFLLKRPAEERNQNEWQVQRRRGRLNRQRRRHPHMDNVNGGVRARGDEDEVQGGMFQLFQAMNVGEVPLDNLLDGREDTNEAQEVNPLQPDEEELHKGNQIGDQDEDQNEDQNEERDEAQDEQLQIQYFVDFPDVWRLNQEQRSILHEYWLDEIKMKYRKQLQTLTEQYENTCKAVNEIDEEINLTLLRRANVVGITTTAAARCQKILQALNSEIVIIEEAAEVLEGHVLACLNPGVKHLVLIGDHLQLRPSTAVYRLGTRHKLDVSMFERLLEGGVEHVALQEQRRMRPSFARLVKSLYPNLKDHESVTKYENVKGINSNLLFFDHTAEENSTTVDMSKVNTTEAKLVVELTLYLLKQDCYSAKNIAILTMYTGQIMEIKRILNERASATLSPKYLERIRKMHEKQARVVEDDEDSEEDEIVHEDTADITKLLPRVSSVDDYQGEEADIIILSLVRSNDIQTKEGEGTIGFLKTSNRICVALTRAKKGMYIFGNATLLAKRSDLWNKVIRVLQNDNALDTKFEFCCQNHPDTKTIVRKEEEFRLVADGGCSRPCEVQLVCGHVCPRRCHPGSHDDVICPKQCRRRASYPDVNISVKETVGSAKWEESTFLAYRSVEKFYHAAMPARPDAQLPVPLVRRNARSVACTAGVSFAAVSCVCLAGNYVHGGASTISMSLAEFEETDRCHQLQDCRHLFEVSGLDTWMDSDHTQVEEGRKSTAVKMKECPECKTPVWRSARYANVIKGKLAELEAVKEKMNGYEKTKEGQQVLEEGNPAKAFILFMEALKLNPALMEAHFGAGQALFKSKSYAHGAIFLSFVVEKSTYSSKVKSVLKSTRDLDKTLGTDKVVCPPPKDEVAVKAMLQLASALTFLGDFTGADKLCEVVLKSHPLNEDAMKIKEDAGKRLRAEVVQVMNLEVGERGHWFQCPNGHFYTIGECGGAMQESKCPDCKATVGGGSHKLAAGNTHAAIDGSSASAWPS
ncbi:hypothetical protein R1flu_005955 [Riccia fluitans]|uniref:NFX1-type zinc finger-containing protein 1 n=1 Tax=Riccia fluitans TaxID=41844 RepID=A0ABD1YV83_9MARC